MSDLSLKLLRRMNENQDSVLYDDQKWFTTQELRHDIECVHSIFQQLGVKPSDRVVVSIPNSYSFIIAYLATILYGATVVPMNPNMPCPEMVEVVRRSGAVGAFVTPRLEESFRKLVSKHSMRFMCLLANHTGTLTSTVLRTTDAAKLSSMFTVEHIEKCPVPYIPANFPENTPAVLLFTSGTTGTPKGVQLTHRQIMSTVWNVSESHQLTARDVSYCFLPLFHINAQVVALLSTLITGGKLVVDEKFSASKFWSTVSQHGVTWASAVPTVITILAKNGSSPTGKNSMRFIRSASAPLPAQTAKQFEDSFGIPVIESYGLTEAASQVCVNPLPPEEHKFGSVGRPCGIELRVVGDNGKQVPFDEIGEICIRGESVVTSYESGEESGKSFRGGWFHTGDLGYIDRDGFVYITGRSKEMINRAGQKISPREVEEVLLRMSTVQVAAVIGLPDELYGERVVAYIVTEKNLSDEESNALKAKLRTLCLDSLSAYKCPAEIHIVSDIPHGVTGKIQRFRLKQLVESAGVASL